MSEVSGRSFATTGLRVANARMRVAMENLANAESTGAAPGADPYRRKHLLFEPIDGRDEPRMRIFEDKSAVRDKMMPGHPAANALGIVRMPNISTIGETLKFDEAIRAYRRNAGVLSTLEDVEKKTLDILKG